MKKKTHILFFTLLLLCSITSTAQQVTFEQVYNIDNRGGIARSLLQTHDGGYILSGYSGGMFDLDYTIVKTDSLGEMEWWHHFGGESSLLESVTHTMDSCFIAAGNTNFNADGSFQEDAALIKYNIQGDTLWYKLYGENECTYPCSDPLEKYYADSFYDVISTSDSCILAVGGSSSYTPYSHSYLPWLVKTDLDGNIIWEWHFPDVIDPNFDNNIVYLTKVIETPEGDYVAIGYEEDPLEGMKTSSTRYGLIMKFSKNGEIMWYREWDEEFLTVFNDVLVAEDGSFYVAASARYTSDDEGPNANKWISMLVHLDENGHKIDYKTIDIGFKVYLKSILMNSNQQIIGLLNVLPYEDLSIEPDALLIAYNYDDYSVEWMQSIGRDSTNDNVRDLIQTTDGGYAFCGSTKIPIGTGAWLVKTDSLGQGNFDAGWEPNAVFTNKTGKLSIYPNPARTEIYVTIPNFSGTANISMYNTHGQLVKSTLLNENAQKIRVSDLPSGMYLIKAQTDNNCYTNKLLIQN
jgi:hypothetical protein